MPEARLLTVDFSEPAAMLRILPRLPLLTSDSLGWNGIHVQYHQQPACEMPEHSHTQHVILVNHAGRRAQSCVLEGQLRHEQRFNGDIVILPAFVPHQVGWQGEGDFTMLMLEPTHLAQTAHKSVDDERVELIPQIAKSDPLIQGIGLTLKSILESHEQCSPLYIDSLTTALAAHLIQHYCRRKYALPNYAGGLAKHHLQKALDYIHSSLDQTISLAAFANLLGMSQYHFCKSFKQSMGVPPYQYVRQQRVERAKQLLKHKDLSIASIALQCGFSDQSHLTKQFRQLTGGMTPKAYREL